MLEVHVVCIRVEVDSAPLPGTLPERQPELLVPKHLQYLRFLPH